MKHIKTFEQINEEQANEALADYQNPQHLSYLKSLKKQIDDEMAKLTSPREGHVTGYIRPSELAKLNKKIKKGPVEVEVLLTKPVMATTTIIMKADSVDTLAKDLDELNKKLHTNAPLPKPISDWDLDPGMAVPVPREYNHHIKIVGVK